MSLVETKFADVAKKIASKRPAKVAKPKAKPKKGAAPVVVSKEEVEEGEYEFDDDEDGIGAAVDDALSEDTKPVMKKQKCAKPKLTDEEREMMAPKHIVELIRKEFKAINDARSKEERLLANELREAAEEVADEKWNDGVFKEKLKHEEEYYRDRINSLWKN